MDDLLTQAQSGDKILGREHFYTKIEWSQPGEEVYKYFFDHVLPQLTERSEDPSRTDVRIVFWFDN
jgi:hypothetical protein